MCFGNKSLDKDASFCRWMGAYMFVWVGGGGLNIVTFWYNKAERRTAVYVRYIFVWTKRHKEKKEKERMRLLKL